jgi:hypothetical protein
VTVPHLEGRTVVDGDRRTRVRGARVALVGWTERAYVVTRSNRAYTRHTTLRVRHDGTRRTLLRSTTADPSALTLSGDGEHLVVVDDRRAPRRTTVTVRSARDGAVVARRAVRGSASVLDMEEGRLVLGAWGPGRTWWWNALSGATKRIADRPGYAADISGNRLASYTRDPYDGGCSVATTLTGRRLWRSCDERVAAFSPEGRRMATVHILSDGLGPTKVTARTARGGLVATYRARWFGDVYWETESALLLDAHGTRRATVARCVADACERAERLRTQRAPRTAS